MQKEEKAQDERMNESNARIKQAGRGFSDERVGISPEFILERTIIREKVQEGRTRR